MRRTSSSSSRHYARLLSTRVVQRSVGALITCQLSYDCDPFFARMLPVLGEMEPFYNRVLSVEGDSSWRAPCYSPHSKRLSYKGSRVLFWPSRDRLPPRFLRKLPSRCQRLWWPQSAMVSRLIGLIGRLAEFLRSGTTTGSHRVLNR